MRVATLQLLLCACVGLAATASTSSGRYEVMLNDPWPTGCAANLKRPQTGLPDFGHWKIGANPDDKFLGPVVATIYKAGNFPHFTGMQATGTAGQNWNCTVPDNCTAVYGGLPQLTNLTAHLAQLQTDIETILPDKDWSGVANIDWEAWKPDWKQNTYNEYWIYINRSVALVQQQHPEWPPAKQAAQAERDFTSAAQTFWGESILLARKIRPGGKWGWYNFPGEASAPLDDDMMWLFDNVNALFPSIYLESADADKNIKRVDTQLAEARRIRDKVSATTGRHTADLPIYTFTWMDYYAGEVTPWISLLDAADLQAALARPATVWGAAGSVLWGSSADTINETLCGDGPGSKSFYVNNSLGPLVLKTAEGAESCAQSRCSGHGTCWCTGGGDGACSPADACDCDDGHTGKTCETLAA